MEDEHLIITRVSHIIIDENCRLEKNRKKRPFVNWMDD